MMLKNEQKNKVSIKNNLISQVCTGYDVVKKQRNCMKIILN